MEKEKEEYFYCAECGYHIKIKDIDEHFNMHAMEDQLNAEEGMLAKIIICSAKQSTENCKICAQKLKEGKKCIEFICCRNVIHLGCRKKVENNSKCSYCKQCHVWFDNIDKECESNYFFAPNSEPWVETNIKSSTYKYVTTKISTQWANKTTLNKNNNGNLNNKTIIIENRKEVEKKDTNELKSKENHKEEKEKKEGEKVNTKVKTISKQSNNNLCKEKEINNDTKNEDDNNQIESDTQYLSNKRNRD